MSAGAVFDHEKRLTPQRTKAAGSGGPSMQTLMNFVWGRPTSVVPVCEGESGK